ncbi:MAG TPA: hypothetical protein VHD56_18805 [Tepidisphaeraceae bacterium]|nr:hypothetical protein [Tepidisphaeraceae bacterium]
MKRMQGWTIVILALLSMGAGPVWYEPAAMTGEAIERAISDAYKDPRGRVFLPGGTYRITKTINLHGLGPMLIEGATEGTIFRESNHPSSAILEWHGPPGQPMIRLNTLGVTFRNMMLAGRGIASHGILLTNSPTVGSGLNRLEDVCLDGFTTACFQAGEAPREGNCADSFFDRVMFLHAPNGFLAINEQSVNNQFMGCQFGWLECALNIERGGALTMIGGGAAFSDLFLKVVHRGHNTGAIHIGPIRIENAGYKNRYMSLVDARPTEGTDHDVDYGLITFQSVWTAGGALPDVPDNVETPLFRLGPGAVVVCEGCEFKQLGDRGQWPIAYVQGAKDIGNAILRSRETYWMGDTKNIVVNEFGKVELLAPLSSNGIETPTVIRGLAP